MTKIIFRKDKPNFEKHKSMHNFDALLEQHRKKAKKRLRLSIVLLLIEVLVVLILVCVAVYKLNSLQQSGVVKDKIENLSNFTNFAKKI
jgi:hypothetical protein